MTRYYEPGEDPHQVMLDRRDQRLADLRMERRDRVVLLGVGVATLAVALGGAAFVLQALWRGVIKEDADSYTYLADDPTAFFASTVFLGAMVAYMGYLGIGMLLHVRRESRRAARLAERLAKVGRRAGGR